jgi:hypothetical protein
MGAGEYMKQEANLIQVMNMTPIVRLLVREKGGLWYVDEGYMLKSRAIEQRAQWRSLGYGCLILKHTLPTVKIVTRPYRPSLARYA